MRNLFVITFAAAAMLCGCNTPSNQTNQDSRGQSAPAAFNQAWDAERGAIASIPSGLVKARIEVAKDGRVLSAVIIQSSGVLEMDKSVQRTLDKVKNIQPFAVGATEKQKTFIIGFSLKPKT